MKIDEHSETAVLRMLVCNGTAANQLKAAAALIRGLPGVFRVGVDSAASQLEILFQYPTAGLLRDIYAMVRLVNTEIVALKVY